MDRVAIIVDAEFFIKQFRQHSNKNASPKEMADALHSLCIQHLYNKHQKHPDKLYRIMVYDCPPMSKKVHHPLTKRSIDLSKTPTAINRLAFHTELRKLRKVALRLGYLDERNASSWMNKSIRQSGRSIIFFPIASESVLPSRVAGITREMEPVLFLRLWSHVGNMKVAWC